jgi:hypothetical protein
MPEEVSQKNPLTKYFSISLGLTFISQLSFIQYYSKFGIQPLQFFDPTELVVNSVKDFFLILLFIYVYTLVLVLRELPKIVRNRRIHIGLEGKPIFLFRKPIKRSRKPDYLMKGWFFRLLTFIGSKQKQRIFLILSIAILAQGVVVILSYFYDKELLFAALTAFLSFFFLGAVFLMLVNLDHWNKRLRQVIVLDRMMSSIVNLLTPQQFVWIMLFVILTSSAAQFKSSAAVKNNKYLGSTFYFATDTIQVHKRFLLIGRSKAYLFFHDPIKNTTTVIKREGLVKETLKIHSSIVSVLFENY